MRQKTNRMKGYVSDRLLFLLFGIIMLSVVPYLYGPASSIWIDIIIIITWGGLCWRIIILPIDLCIGTVTKTFNVLKPLLTVDSLVLSSTQSYLWRVIDTETGEILSLVVPESIITKKRWLRRIINWK